MSDKGIASERRGTGLLPAGIIIALLIAVAAFITLRSGTSPDEADVAAVVAPTSPDASQTGPSPEEAAAPTPDAGNDGDEQTSVEQEGVEPEVTQAPSVDEVRVDGSGTMVIAGRGDPGSQVDVLLDGEVVTSAEVDGSGAFAALTDLPESQAARSLTLQSGEGDAAVASREEIILAPVVSSSGSGQAEDPVDNVDIARAAEPEAAAPDAEKSSEEPVIALVEDAVTDVEGVAEEAAVDFVTEETSDGTNAAVQQQPAETVAVATEAEAAQPSDASEQVASVEADKTIAPAETETPAAKEAEDKQQIAVLRSDDQGVTLVQPPAPLPDTVVLDTISYNDDGVVQLAGRASGAAQEVRVYLNNRPIARLDVRSDGVWRGAVPGVAPGVYRLRIDALTEDGRVASRIETPFKREAPEVLAAATNESDETGTVRAVTVQAGDTLWAIARDRYGEGLLFVQVFEANRGSIRDPDLIYPGQVFDLPDN